MPREHRMRKGDDFHLHLRRKEMMELVIAFTVLQFCRATVMPNTKPEAILTAADAQEYYDEIKRALKKIPGGDGFEPIMTIEIRETTTPEMIRAAYRAGVRCGKVYPRSQTTNSDDGVSELGYKSAMFLAVLAEMEKLNMLLLLHGELPNYQVLGRNRETAFLETLRFIAKSFPNLKIVLEHITTKAAVEAVKELDNVAASITVHHLFIVQDDVIGYSADSGNLMRPHLMCKPIAKDPEDRAALIEAAMSGNPKFFYGGDSAPHSRETKECAGVCAGVFNAPVAMQLLAQLFAEYNKLDMLEDFVSTFGARWYGLPLNDQTITLVEESWVVPSSYSGERKHEVVPFMAGKKINWQIAM